MNPFAIWLLLLLYPFSITLWTLALYVNSRDAEKKTKRPVIWWAEQITFSISYLLFTGMVFYILSV